MSVAELAAKLVEANMKADKDTHDIIKKVAAGINSYVQSDLYKPAVNHLANNESFVARRMK